MSHLPDTPMPSLDLLRQITDRHVVERLLQARTLTRAEVSTQTGISKPTISESMRRLVANGLVIESGHQTGRRGRAGIYYSLRDDLGAAAAVSADQAGLTAQIVDVRGQSIGCWRSGFTATPSSTPRSAWPSWTITQRWSVRALPRSDQHTSDCSVSRTDLR